jgi:hypothetical protein
VSHGALVKEEKISWDLLSQTLESIKGVVFNINLTSFSSLTSAPGALVRMVLKTINEWT